MFKEIALVLCLVLVMSVGGTIASEYKEAPLPHYDEAKGYGWMTEVPVDGPDTVQSVMKAFVMYGNRAIFMDINKDGECDTVANFSQINPNEDMFMRIQNTTCEETQNQIDRFLETVAE